MSLKDRHLFGAGAAVCAACCAAPLLTLLGIAGAAATVATFVFAGVVFGLVVAAGAILAVWSQRRRRKAEACAPDTAASPVDLEFSAKRPMSDA
jgi:membrane protein implicated in regulation of membrane protease activity